MNTAFLFKYTLLMLLLVSTCSCLQVSDPIDFGTLCTPLRDKCDDVVLLDRGTTLGRNAIDFSITNTSAADIEAYIQAKQLNDFTSSQEIEQTADTGVLSLASIATNCSFCPFRVLDVLPGETRKGRFIPQELGREPRLSLTIGCQPTNSCIATVRWVLINEPNECVIKEDCNNGWLCDTGQGQCVECLSTDDCIEGQECTLGRCTPPQQEGCMHTGTAKPQSAPTHPMWVICMLVIVLILSARRTHARGTC